MSFLPAMLRNPRTVCGCQPVDVRISSLVAPVSRRRRSRTLAFLLAARGTAASLLAAFLVETLVVGLVVGLAALRVAGFLAALWPLGAPFFRLACFLEAAFPGASWAACAAGAAFVVVLSMVFMVVFVLFAVDPRPTMDHSNWSGKQAKTRVHPTYARLLADMSKKPVQLPDLDHWLTKRQAAALLGVGEKTIERMANRAEVQKAKRKRPGAPMQVIYHPGDLERIKANREEAPGAFLVPTETRALAPSTQTRPTGILAMSEAATLHALAAMAAATAGVRQAERLFLTVKEAARFAGLGECHLRRQIKAGKLPLLKGAGHKGSDVVRRADLETL